VRLTDPSGQSRERALERARFERSSPLSLRLSAVERERIERAAGTVPVSTYIKSRLFGAGASAHRANARNPKAEHRTLAQLLARLGASQAATALRELADAARSGSLALDTETKASLDRACADVSAMRDMLMVALGLKVVATEPAVEDVAAAFNVASESSRS